MATRSSVQSSAENSHAVSDHVAARAHEAVDRVAETAREVETRTREAAAMSVEKVGEKQEQARR